MFDDIYTLIDGLPNTLNDLRLRVGQLVNLCNIETGNASRRWLDIQSLNSELATKSARITELEEQLEELGNARKAWWPTLREELAKPEYSTLVASKDVDGLFDLLSTKNIAQQLDPIPISDLRSAFATAFSRLAFWPNDNPAKSPWDYLLTKQLAVLGNATLIPASEVQGLAASAIAAGLLDAGTVIGSKLVSRLEVLNLEDRVKSPIDITEAMGW